MKKSYSKHIFLLDKIPYILFGLILIITLIIFFLVRSHLPLTFFSGMPESEENETEYSLFIASPTSGQSFNFTNENETVPVEIKAKEAESSEYKINVFVNEDKIKSFTSPPYKYNWNPGSSGEYKIIARLVDDNNNVIAESNAISFTVQYESEPEVETNVSTDIKEKKDNVISSSTFRYNNTIPTGLPIFSYRCYTPPVIDGVIQEWDKYESFSSFAPTFKKENYTHTDIGGIFYSCWDDDNFYFAIKVIDDVFNQQYTGNQINKGDSITIVFDTALEEDMQINFYNSDDFRIDFSPGNFGGISAESFMNWPLSAPPAGTIISSKRLSGGGYVIEASIPWYNFAGYTPEDKDVLGFTISILDTDNLESTECVISSSKTFDFNNTSTLGAIALIDVGDVYGSPEEETSDSSENPG